jgi:hypothetical protein
MLCELELKGTAGLYEGSDDYCIPDLISKYTYVALW